MFELLRSLKEYTEELEKKALKIKDMEMSGTVLELYDFTGLELIEEVERFFLTFWAAIEVKGLKDNKAATVVAFLKTLHHKRQEIAELFKEEKEKKEKEDQIKKGEKELWAFLRERAKRVVLFYSLIGSVFKNWNAYPFGSLRFTELKK